MDRKRYQCSRCQDSGQVLVSYVPRYDTCPVCNGTLTPQKPQPKVKKA